MTFRNVKIRSKRENCAVCGDAPSITDVKKIDYDDFCQTKCDRYSLFKIPPSNQITCLALKKLIDEKAALTIIDVRPPVQFKITALPNAINVSSFFS